MNAIQHLRFTEGPIGIAALAAIGLHLVVVLGVSFDLLPNAPSAPKHIIDINLVIPVPTPKPIEAPDFLSQTSQQGGGDKVQQAHAASPPSKPTNKQKPKPQPKPSSEAEEKKRAQTIRQKPVHTYQVVDPAETTDVFEVAKTKPKPDLAQLLASSQQTIDLLTAELDTHAKISANQPKRKAINTSTQEYQYAAYLDAWRKKIERVGNLNYPDEAQHKRLYGALLLHVAVRADGSLEAVRLLRSSGHKVLDEAAKRIVRLSAPFAPFPPNIRQKVDVLDITRTWQFHSGQGLFSSN